MRAPGRTTTMRNMSSRPRRAWANPRRHRPLVALLLVLGALAALGASGAVWIDRQALDTANWADTSSRLIVNPRIRRAVAGYAVRSAFSAAGIDRALRQALPAPLATAAEARVRGLAQRVAARLLAGGAARRAWRMANRQAQRQLLAILARRGRPGEAVTLNLAPLLHDLLRAVAGNAIVQALPGGGRLLGAVPAGSGRLVVLRGDQVRRARGAVDAVRALAVALPVAAVVLLTLAVAAARGWRRIALRRAGYGLIAVGVIVVAARALLAGPLADALVSSGTDRAAARAAWMIATAELRDTAVIVGACGVAAVAVGWLASAAVTARSRIRPRARV